MILLLALPGCNNRGKQAIETSSRDYKNETVSDQEYSDQEIAYQDEQADETVDNYFDSSNECVAQTDSDFPEDLMLDNDDDSVYEL